MKNFFKIALLGFALALSATAYCSTPNEVSKAEQAYVVVSPPEIQSADIVIVPLDYITVLPFTSFEQPCVIDSRWDLIQTQTEKKAVLCPCTDIFLNSHRCTMCRRYELDASTGYKQHVKHFPYSRHVYTKC